MRVGLFGGSFDPIHHGHLIVARVVAEALALDQLLLVPAAEQPFKVGQHGAEAEHRLAMARLAVAGEPGLAVDPIEVDRPGPSYTVDTLRALADRWPGVRLALLLGSDAARQLPEWREPAAVRALAELVVFERPGEGAGAPPADRVVPVPRIDISSTEVRARVRRGLPVRYWVPDAVAAYIRAHRLYREA